MSKKCKKGCTTLNYIEPFFIVASGGTGCVLISAFASCWYSYRNYEFCSWSRNCATTAGIKKFKSIIKKKRKRKEKIFF